jgi:hypothetical protein
VRSSLSTFDAAFAAFLDVTLLFAMPPFYAVSGLTAMADYASFRAICSSKISRTVNGMMIRPLLRKNASISASASRL